MGSSQSPELHRLRETREFVIDSVWRLRIEACGPPEGDGLRYTARLGFAWFEAGTVRDAINGVLAQVREVLIEVEAIRDRIDPYGSSSSSS